jgi:type IV secretory pathway TrbF-like protein
MVDKPPTEDALMRVGQHAWELPEHTANMTLSRGAFKTYSTYALSLWLSRLGGLMKAKGWMHVALGGWLIMRRLLTYCLYRTKPKISPWVPDAKPR